MAKELSGIGQCSMALLPQFHRWAPVGGGILLMIFATIATGERLSHSVSDLHFQFCWI